MDNSTNLKKTSRRILYAEDSFQPIDPAATNDETVYLWYRRNITLTDASARSILNIRIRKANAFLFFLNGQYISQFDAHNHNQGILNATIALDLSQFKVNQQYLFEILSVTLGIDNSIYIGDFDYKGIVGHRKSIWIHHGSRVSIEL